jgi:hypothetical protein
MPSRRWTNSTCWKVPEKPSVGFFIAIVSYQPDVATGKVDHGFVEAINAQITENLGIDESRACYEVDGPDATCYKPKLVMQFDSAKHNDLDLGRSYTMGAAGGT